jgi:hypothetical protein
MSWRYPGGDEGQNLCFGVKGAYLPFLVGLEIIVAEVLLSV